MPSHRTRIGQALAGLFLVATAAGCGVLGPHLHVDVDNTGGGEPVTVTVTTSAAPAGEGDVTVPIRTGSAWRVPLGSVWEVKVGGRHVIGSSDRPDLALPAQGWGQDVMVSLQVAPDGSVKVVGACLDEDVVDGRCAGT